MTVQDYITEVEKTSFFGGVEVPLSLENQMAYYRVRIPLRRAVFRTMTVGVVAFGVANAFIAARGEVFLSGPAKDTLIVALSLLIGATGTLNAVFRIEAAWTGYTSTLMTLEHLKRRWEKVKVEAITADDPMSALERLRHESWDIQEEMHRLIAEETKGFFASRRLPEVGKV